MSVTFIGTYNRMGPVKADTGDTIARGDIVQITSGTASDLTAGAKVNLAVALDSYPDAEYEGTKTHIEVALLGEDIEIEVPFALAGGIGQANIGEDYGFLATGVLDLTDTTDVAFRIRRLGRDTSFTDTSGYVIGVMLDSASF